MFTHWKRILILSMLLALATLTACGNPTSSTGSKALEEGKLSLADGDYAAAENYFKLAMDEGISDDTLSKDYDILCTFNDARDAFDNQEYASAQTLLDGLGSHYQDMSLASNVNTMKKQTADILTAASDLEKAAQYVSGSQYAEAQVVLDGLKQDTLTDSQKADRTRLLDAVAAGKEESTAAAPTVVVVQPPAGYYQPDRITQAVPVYTGDYLFPSDTQYISNTYLDLCSKSEVKLLRNEIYARHGYVFKTDEYRNYFNARSWYSPNSNFDVSMLNSIERANVDTIVKYEDRMGW